ALGECKNADEATRVGDSLDLIVGEIAHVVEHAASIGVADEQRRAGGITRLEKTFATSVREGGDHASSIRLFDDLDTKIRQASTGAVFPHTVTQLITKIPNGLQGTQTQAVEVSQIMDAAAQRHAAFE